MENLHFTPRHINEIENQRKRPITEVVGEFSLSTITLFVKKGLGLPNDQEAENAIESYLAEGHDMIELYLYILEMLQKSGFLPKALDLSDVKMSLNNPATFKQELNSSANVGSEANQ